MIGRNDQAGFEMRQALRKEANRRKLTLTDIAKRMKLGMRYLSRIMQGDRQLSPAMMNRILDAMDVKDVKDRRRFHSLGARTCGWQIEERDIKPVAMPDSANPFSATHANPRYADGWR